MQGKAAAFIVGAGLGFALATRAGREQLDKVKVLAQDAWADPRVQSQVTDISTKVTYFAKTEGSALKDRVTDFAKTEGIPIKDKLTETVRSALGSVKGAVSDAA